MPNGKIHDAVTLALTVPVCATAYVMTGSFGSAGVVAASFMFGGLMFGPDLDTVSVQYSRWGFLKPLWLPYRVFFPHRSRWSHGLLFGALFRIVYFMGVLTIASFATVFLVESFRGGKMPELLEFGRSWDHLGALLRSNFGGNVISAAGIGLWLGAASHTLTDVAFSYIKTGRRGELL
ncbi:MAG: metal-binding protein [Pyrinomonadaceae bacterium]